MGTMNLRLWPAFEKWKLVSQMVDRVDAECIQAGCHSLTGIKLAYSQLNPMRQKLLASHCTDEQKRLCQVEEAAEGHRTAGFELRQLGSGIGSHVRVGADTAVRAGHWPWEGDCSSRLRPRSLRV